MGARQSKRSVDITTGKEAVVEGGEVAASGGEGKLERIEDVDQLKPQLNGDTAHQDGEILDKEKKLQEDESPENEKDNCNEKEIILSPVVNGGGGGDAATEMPKEAVETVEAETNKKNKKEKRKWSFRNISFSKKDKQKPAKKNETAAAAAVATNGECEKVPEEVAENTASNDAEKKVETEVLACELKKAEEVIADKAPETPVTEPITNGSSAPESPKEEIKQNGDSTSVDEPSAAVEAKESMDAPEPPKSADPVESVVPMNGLKIDDSAETVPPQSEPEIEEQAVEKITEVANAEVCVVKESKEVAEVVEVAPPPLPANPPPSSLTIFAESTMAPHLVDKQLVGEPHVVDVGVSSASEPTPNPENVQQTNTDAPPPPVCEDKCPIDNASEALPKDEVVVEDSQSSETHTNSNEISEPIPDKIINTPLNSEQVVSESIAVVSSNESEPAQTNPSDVAPVLDQPVTETVLEVKSTEDNKAPEISSPPVVDNIVADVPVENIATETQDSIPESINNVPIEQPSENVSNEEKSIELPSALEVSECVNVDILPNEALSNVNTESPLPQRTPSDPDISENAFPSDSFPPPPPPVSCPESITEISASESLPPPLSETSHPDAVTNSPTSETVDFPTKDLPSPIKENGNADLKDSLEQEESKSALTNGEHQTTPTTLPETNFPPPPEVVQEAVAEPPSAESLKLQSTDNVQVNPIKEIADIAPMDTVVDSIPAENCVVAAE